MQLADQTVAEARRMREAHLRRTLAPEPRRARYVCPVGRGTANRCGAQVQVLTRHLATHFLRDSEEVRAHWAVVFIPRFANYCQQRNLATKVLQHHKD